MPFLRNMIRPENRNIENPNDPLTGSTLLRLFGAEPTSSGVSVTPESALRNAEVYAAVKIIAESVSMLPLLTYRNLGSGKGRELATDHPLYPILSAKANPEMTALEVIEAMTGHVALRGNGYAHIVRDNGGRVKELWPMRPDRVFVWRKFGAEANAMPGGDLEYVYTPYGGEPVKIPADQVLHVRGMSAEGLIGYSPIDLERETIGAAIAAQRYGAKFFANDGRPGGVLVHPGTLSDKAYNRLRDSWADAHVGFTNAHKFAILEEGVSWQSVGLAPEQAQFLQTRQLGIADIARIFRVPLHLMNYADHTQRGTAETMSLEFVRFTLLPWLLRWEQAIALRLFTQDRDKNYFAKFNLNLLLRGDTAARVAFYQTGRQNGWLSTNDIREMEDLNPIPDSEGGNIYLAPLNMVPLDKLIQEGVPSDTTTAKPEDGGQGGDEPDPEQKGPVDTAKGQPKRSAVMETRTLRSVAARKRLRAPYRRMFADAAARAIKREQADITRAAGRLLGTRDGQSFDDWLDEFYAGISPAVQRTFSPVVQSYAEAIAAEAADEIAGQVDSHSLQRFITAYLSAYASRHAAENQQELRKAISATDGSDEAVRTAVTDTLARMVAEKPAEVAANEAVRADNAFARSTYASNGVTKLRWVTSGGKSCAYCTSLDGKVVGIEQNFLEQGADYKPEGADSPLRPSTSIGHAPCHRGCECSVVASTE